MSIEDDIVRQFPQYAFMLQDPELHWLLVAHLDPARGFDSGAFQADLVKTNWWRTHSGAQRQWLQQTTMDPASAQSLVEKKIGEFQVLRNEGGLNLTDNELRWEATLALQNNWDDRQARANLLWVAGTHGQTPGQTGGMTGQMAVNGEDIKKIARDYFIPMTDQRAGEFAQGIFAGTSTVDDVRGSLSAWAAGLNAATNPDLAAYIKAGGTSRQWFDPQIQGVSQLLEVAPDQIDPLNAKYAPLINYTDPNAKAGSQPRMMTVAEAQKWARNQPEWWNTDNGRQTTGSYTSALLQGMGAIR